MASEANEKLDMFQALREFHEKFGLGYSGPPRKFPLDLALFRIMFMHEELNEYMHASNLHEQLDALVDLVYVAIGTAYMHGFPFDEAFQRVHEANMKKAKAKRPEESSRGGISKYDIIKPEGWQRPTFEDLLYRDTLKYS